MAKHPCYPNIMYADASWTAIALPLGAVDGQSLIFDSKSPLQLSWGPIAKGEKGDIGPQGIPGRDGANGRNGVDGLPGLPGATGATGPQGPAGKDGTNGRDGVDGKNGQNGATPLIGPNNTWVIGGVDTLQPTKGIDGTNGKDGLMGPIGPAGSTGQQGSPGPQGPQGTTGAKGDTGPQGETGPAGPQGPQGTAATIAVGTTTTLPAGSSATVTNIGTSTAAIFDFGIPGGGSAPFTTETDPVYTADKPAIALKTEVSGLQAEVRSTYVPYDADGGITAKEDAPFRVVAASIPTNVAGIIGSEGKRVPLNMVKTGDDLSEMTIVFYTGDAKPIKFMSPQIANMNAIIETTQGAIVIRSDTEYIFHEIIKKVNMYGFRTVNDAWPNSSIYTTDSGWLITSFTLPPNTIVTRFVVNYNNSTVSNINTFDDLANYMLDDSWKPSDATLGYPQEHNTELGNTVYPTVVRVPAGQRLILRDGDGISYTMATTADFANIPLARKPEKFPYEGPSNSITVANAIRFVDTVKVLKTDASYYELQDEDYTVSGSTITINNPPPATGMRVKVKYYS